MGTETKHTPAPWHTTAYAEVQDAVNRCIATVNRGGYFSGEWSRPEWRADARLIAAAPDLYSAVVRLMNVGRTAIDARPDLDWNDLCALINRIDGD